MTNPDRPVGPLDWQNLKLSIGVQILDADPPAQGVNIAGRMTIMRKKGKGLWAELQQVEEMAAEDRDRLQTSAGSGKA